MGVLDALIYGIRDVFDGLGIQLPRRSRIKFTGTVTDDPVNDQTIVYSVPNGTGDVVFTEGIQTLSDKIISGPEIIGGYSQTYDNRVSMNVDPISTQTSSTSQTTVGFWLMSNETLVTIDVLIVVARRTNVTKGGSYKRSVTYRRTGGGAPQIVGSLETIGTDHETTAGDDITIDVSGNDIRVRFTAADSDPRNIGGFMQTVQQLAT